MLKPRRWRPLTACVPECPEAASCLHKNRIADEMEPDAIGRLAIVEIGGNRFSHLLLKIAQIFALCSDPAGLTGGVPRRDKPRIRPRTSSRPIIGRRAAGRLPPPSLISTQSSASKVVSASRSLRWEASRIGPLASWAWPSSQTPMICANHPPSRLSIC